MKRRQKKRTGDDGSAYSVGYKKPPVDHQFKKGVSGNPRGRPKKSHSWPSALRDQLLRFVSVRENGQSKRMTAVEALLAKAITDALHNRGHKALIDILKLLQTTGLLSLEEMNPPELSKVTIQIVRPDHNKVDRKDDQDAE